MNKQNNINTKLSKKECPKDNICGFCNKENNFHDELGFFYIIDARDGIKKDDNGNITNTMLPACSTCYFKYREHHIELYGIGER